MAEAEKSRVERYCELAQPIIVLKDEIVASLVKRGYAVEEERRGGVKVYGLGLNKKDCPIGRILLMFQLSTPEDDLDLARIESDSYLSIAGRIAGSVKSPKKARASRRNGKLGGRPKLARNS